MGLPRRADRDAVEPAAQQIGVADRRLPCGRARGRRPGTRPRRAGDHPESAGRRAGPSDHAGRPVRRTPVPRPRPGRALNRSSNCPSLRPAIDPPSKSDSICRMIAPFLLGPCQWAPRAAILNCACFPSSTAPSWFILSEVVVEKSAEGLESQMDLCKSSIARLWLDVEIPEYVVSAIHTEIRSRAHRFLRRSNAGRLNTFGFPR